MDSHPLESLRPHCRDEEAFEQLKQALMRLNEPLLQAKRHSVSDQLLARIHAAHPLDIILRETVKEVHELLNADRVGIFRFTAHSRYQSGEFVAEAVLPDFHSALDVAMQDHCCYHQHITAYQEGQSWIVADTHTADLSADCLDTLRRFQVRAHVTMPLIVNKTLWGLLCIHQCATPRRWQPDELEFIYQITNGLNLAIQQDYWITQSHQQAIALTELQTQLTGHQTTQFHHQPLASLGRLLGGITSEILQPIDFVSGHLAQAKQQTADLLQQLANSLSPADGTAPTTDDSPYETLPQILDSMQLGIQRIHQMMESLHRLTSYDAIEPQPLDVHEGIDQALLLLHHRLKPRTTFAGIRVIKEYGQLPPVQGWEPQLNQAFLQVLTNAVDALEDRSQVKEGLAPSPLELTIRTGLIPDFQSGISRVIIRIADNGTGIPYNLQSQLFEPFFTTKPSDRGAGLGLSISRKIVVEQHGGSLDCYSQSGEGTEFWIELPVQLQPLVSPFESFPHPCPTPPIASLLGRSAPKSSYANPVYSNPGRPRGI